VLHGHGLLQAEPPAPAPQRLPGQHVSALDAQLPQDSGQLLVQLPPAQVLALQLLLEGLALSRQLLEQALPIVHLLLQAAHLVAGLFCLEMDYLLQLQ
jgi:hypothetical protein